MALYTVSWPLDSLCEDSKYGMPIATKIGFLYQLDRFPTSWTSWDRSMIPRTHIRVLKSVLKINPKIDPKIDSKMDPKIDPKLVLGNNTKNAPRIVSAE